MFKRFVPEEQISSKSQVKSSIQRAILKKIQQQYDISEDLLNALFPKKSPFLIAKCQNHVNLVSTLCFFIHSLGL